METQKLQQGIKIANKINDLKFYLRKFSGHKIKQVFISIEYTNIRERDSLTENAPAVIEDLIIQEITLLRKRIIDECNQRIRKLEKEFKEL